MKYFIYETATGKGFSIVDVGVKEDILFPLLQLQEGQGFLSISDTNLSTTDENTYVLNGELTAKPAQDTTVNSTTLLANGVDTITISNAPANSLLTLTNVVTGETVIGTFSNTEEIFSVSAGKLILTIECFPYLDYTIELEAL